MKVKKYSRSEPEFIIFKYLWFLIILPKTLQFFLLVAILLYCLYRGKRLKLSKTMVPFVLGVCVQIIAITFQLISNNVDTDRLMASLNTSLIWIVGAFYFSLYSQSKYSQDSIIRLKKYVLYNFIVIILLYILSKIYKGTYINILGIQLALRRNDYISGSLGSRFCALMETPLASSHFFLLSIPIIIYHSTKYKRRHIVEIVIVIGAFISCAAAHSRIGILISLVALIPYTFSLLEDYGVKKNLKIIVIGIIATVGLIYILFEFGYLYKTIASFFLSREGSNNARFQVYKLSIEKAWKESPVIGIGIKYMMNNYIPFGSHSTYVGFFYKTGFLGCGLFLWGFYNVISRVKNTTRHFTHGMELFVAFLIYFAFLVFADIDGIDWVMACLFSMWGLLSNMNNIPSKPIRR